MKALVTGANGFIGSFLVERLLKEGMQIRCLVRKTSNLQWIKNLNIELCYGKLADPNSLIPAVSDVDYIFHLAGRTKGITETDYIAGNFHATCNLLQAAAEHTPRLKKFIFISSQAAAGPSVDGTPLSENDAPHPVSAYGKSKQMAEDAVMNYSKNFAVSIVRPPSVYGPRDKDFHIMFKNAKKGFVPVAGNGKQKISIVYIDDLIDGILLATQAEGNEIYFINDDRDYSWIELAEQIAKVSSKHAFCFCIPVAMVKMALFFATLYSRLSGKSILLNKDKVLEMQQHSWLCSNQKAKEKLFFQPKTNLEDGTRKTAAWYRQYNWI